MSNEVNVLEVLTGTIDAGVEIDFYDWSGNLGENQTRARFYTVIPDPKTYFPGGYLELAPSQMDIGVTREWMTVWLVLDASNNPVETMQRNVSFVCDGPGSGTYHLLRAETDN